MMSKLLVLLLASFHAAKGAPLPSAQYFTQKQDHFDGTNTNTWQQAYYVNDTYFTPGGPVLLCMGGEGPPLDGSVVVASVHCSVANNMAKPLGALMLALQHRYYGCQSNITACPVESFNSAADLKFLSSRQALGDMAEFHAFISAKYNLSVDINKWITFGGSYPGMLAAWSRLKFPHLIHASISSSAPVHAKLDMREYNDMVAYAYSVDLVGGSDACVGNITEGHAIVGKMFETDEGRAMLAQLFGDIPSADWLKIPANQATFAGYGVASFPSQSNDPLCDAPACNIEKICNIMVNASIGDSLHRLSWLRKVQGSGGVKNKLMVQAANLPDFWGYQCCTEFAFYQTCEVGSKCPFTQGLVTLESSLKYCQSEYGLSNASVAANVAYSDVYYGADHPAGDRVFWVNGQIDPWGALSVLKPSDGFPTLMVQGASHHAWTHPFNKDDSIYLTAAREAIFAQVVLWLDDDH